jgi:hypothetical protein
MSVITYNPLYVVFSEEYSDASVEQRLKIIQSKCREGETIILTLSKMFPGDILSMEITELNLSAPCTLRTFKDLDPKEQKHILSISPHLQIT